MTHKEMCETIVTAIKKLDPDSTEDILTEDTLTMNVKCQKCNFETSYTIYVNSYGFYYPFGEILCPNDLSVLVQTKINK